MRDYVLNLLGDYTNDAAAAAAAAADLPTSTSRSDGLLISRAANVYTPESATLCLRCGAQRGATTPAPLGRSALFRRRLANCQAPSPPLAPQLPFLLRHG